MGERVQQVSAVGCIVDGMDLACRTEQQLWQAAAAAATVGIPVARAL